MHRFPVSLLITPALCLAAAPILLAPGQPAQAENDTAGRMALGESVFVEVCAACHGSHGTDGPGGDIRGLAPGIVLRALREFEQMPQQDLSGEETAAVAAYLMTID